MAAIMKEELRLEANEMGLWGGYGYKERPDQMWVRGSRGGEYISKVSERRQLKWFHNIRRPLGHACSETTRKMKKGKTEDKVDGCCEQRHQQLCEWKERCRVTVSDDEEPSMTIVVSADDETSRRKMRRWANNTETDLQNIDGQPFTFSHWTMYYDTYLIQW